MNIVDGIIGFFNPQSGLARTQARQAIKIQKRGYDAAGNGTRNRPFLQGNTSARDEASKSANKLAAMAQEQMRNDPLAVRVKKVWSNNIVGKGIQLDITGKSKRAKRIQRVWNEWAKSTDCDFNERNNLQGLQWLWAATIVESGGVFIRMYVDDRQKGTPLCFQTFEQDQLDRTKQGENVIDGIQYDTTGRLKGYWLFTTLDDSKNLKRPESKYYSKGEVYHAFKQERAGQHLGVTWCHAILTLLRSYNALVDAKLTQQQVAACFALIVEKPPGSGGIGVSERTELPDSIEPGMIESVDAGGVPHVVTPPKADASNNFEISVKHDLAVGVGLSYSMLTNDYSRDNFANGRMGKNEFNNELDVVQGTMMIPLMNKIFSWFMSVSGEQLPADSEVEWVFPPRSGVNPKEELEIIVDKVRNGLMSPQKAAKLYGERLGSIIEAWKEAQELFKKNELPFDIDPSQFASTGNQIIHTSTPTEQPQND